MSTFLEPSRMHYAITVMDVFYLAGFIKPFFKKRCQEKVNMSCNNKTKKGQLHGG